MKTTMKIITMAVLVVMILAVSTSAFAFDPGTIINDIDNKANTSAGQNTQVNDIAGRILGLIRNVAVVAGVIILSVIGIKFMLGSAEEKAEYKKSLIPLVVGIIVVMAASQIIAMIFGFFA